MAATDLGGPRTCARGHHRPGIEGIMGRSIFVWAGRILAGHQPRNEGDRHEPVRPIQAGQLAHARSLRQVAHSTDQQITDRR